MGFDFDVSEPTAEPAPGLLPAPSPAYNLEPAHEATGAKVLTVAFTLNGHPLRVEIQAGTTLLQLLQGKLRLTGTKPDCDTGQCGACTVLVAGRRVLSCLTLAATLEQKDVVTVEGLAAPGRLHPLQAAFRSHDAYQCDRCTSGQLMSAVGFLKEPWPLSPEGIREGMMGNVCSCGSHSRVAAAIADVRNESTALVA